MTGNEYHKLAMRTANLTIDKRRRIVDGVLGLTGESGEVADLLKKHLFQGHELECGRLAEELGDVLWYIVLTADSAGYTLEQIMKMNIDKLARRYPDGFSEYLSVHRNEK